MMYTSSLTRLQVTTPRALLDVVHDTLLSCLLLDLAGGPQLIHVFYISHRGARLVW